MPDSLAAGIAACRARRFREAIPLLENGLRKELKDSLRQHATVCLLESYLFVNNLAGARRIVESERIVDGYYFLLAGRAFESLGELPQAIDALSKAQTVPSKYKKDLRRRRDAMFLWAKAVEDAYAAKPNSENKRLARRAWQQFSEAFCGEAEPFAGQCRDAGERLRNLAP
jgi:tetratricopeptide (TPR) repeat protein